MNFFELYQLPISFHPDQNEVKKQFYALSKKYHPDFYINEGEEKQNEVLELSTLNNRAFQVLKDQQKVLKYVLDLLNVIEENENYTLPQAFLMEMMDINETIMDLQFDPDTEKLEIAKKSIAELELNLITDLERLTNAYDLSVNQEEKQQLLKDIKDIYYRNKYVNRLNDQLLKLK